jgi:rhamnosyltransferase
MSIKASILIPTKNGGELFKAILRRLVTQQASWPFEILVIDSGSTDGTVEACRAFPQVRVHCIIPEEFGHGRTRNLGVAMARGDFVAVLTQDALPADDRWLQKIVEAVEQSENIAGAFGRHLPYQDANPFVKRDLELHFEGFLCQEGGLFAVDDRVRYDADVGYRQFLHFFSDNNACIRKSVWERIPYPDVDFAEDQLWAKKVIEAGYVKAYAHEAAVYHSHNFSFIERFQRSFDESYAFLRLFGYNLCPGYRGFLRTWMALNRRDLAYARSSNVWCTHPKAVLSAPIDNLMTLAGHCLGARGDRLPDWMRIRVSRDKRLLTGLSKIGRVQGAL